MTLLAVGLYAFVLGLWTAEWCAERRNRPLRTAHDAIRDAARKALQARAFVGDGPTIQNVSEWKLGRDRFRITIEPVANNEKEHATNA